ncbi:hypothetical protein MM817_02947 [Acidibacillus sp. S0AB]|uniref:Polymerase nucleotidyl transferase domain-containing protein n=2 Tax=Sulfoacidibacillus ferrooxidans TaxID=2005001 RepID=A0A9X1VBF7_9BACL|nr:hypothetical protein [Sulfoacidibacillus ferrooxidans]
MNRVDPSGEFSWRWIGNFPRYIEPPAWVYSDFFAANPEFSAPEEAEAELAVRLEGTGNASRMTMNLQRFAQDSNKLNHIFGKSEHNLEEFLQGYEGNQVRAYNALENATQEYVEVGRVSLITFTSSLRYNRTVSCIQNPRRFSDIRGGDGMSTDEQQVIEKVVRQLVETLPIERIILFGSRARGDAGIDSDYDFLVIMDSDIKPSRRGLMARQKGLVPGVPMDFMVRTPEEWDRGFPLKKEITAEGKIVFERGDQSLARKDA